MASKKMKVEVEQWRDVIGYEGLYKVSNYGRVVSMRDRIELKTYKNDGYKMVRISKSGQKKNFRVHRLVAITFIPNPENKPQVNHRDGDKLNNDHYNLSWSTPKENMEHAVENCLTYTKITSSEIRLMRALHRDHKEIFPIKTLAKMFCISTAHTSNIINMKTRVLVHKQLSFRLGQ